MWVVSVENVVRMEGLPRHHQDLKKEGILVKWRPGMKATFVSHQWLGVSHPDPEGKQFSVLKKFLIRFRDSKISIGPDLHTLIVFGPFTQVTAIEREALTSGYIWFDWFSIPQCVGEAAGCSQTRQDQLTAINSISGYVRKASAFLVLCPPCLHTSGAICNHESWEGRGWCRAEQMFHVLSAPDALVIKVFSPTNANISNIGAHALHAPVGVGKLSNDSDRAYLRTPVEDAIQHRLNMSPSAAQETDLLGWRIFHQLRDHLLEGLPGDTVAANNVKKFVPGKLPSEEEQQAFLTKLRFSSWFDEGVHGIGPLECAAIAGDAGAIRAACAAGVDPNRRIHCGVRRFYLTKGSTPLMLAAKFGGPEGTVELLNAKANPNLMDLRIGFTALVFAAQRPADDARTLDVVSTLLNGRADPLIGGNGMIPLIMACVTGSIPLASLLLRHAGPEQVNRMTLLGQTPLCQVCQHGGNVELAKVLLDHGADVNHVNRPLLPTLDIACRLFRAACWLGKGAGAVEELAEHPGSTALHKAAFHGHYPMVKLLLEHRADQSVVNDRGHKPIDLARRLEHLVLLDCLAGVKTESEEDVLTI